MLGRKFDRGFGKKMALDILSWESFYEITYEVNINREEAQGLSFQAGKQLEVWMKARIQQRRKIKNSQ